MQKSFRNIIIFIIIIIIIIILIIITHNLHYMTDILNFIVNSSN